MSDYPGADPQTLRFNRLIVRELSRAPRWETLQPAEVRAAVRAGVMGPAAPRRDDVAQDREIKGPSGPLRLRIFVPDEVIGIGLHIHGGGFVTGGADQQDELLWRRAEEANLAVVSVDYRLAPEHPWPAAGDDCEAAARWLLDGGARELGAESLVVFGESAGACLAAGTLLRLRDRHGWSEACGAALTYGIYDLRGTPSARLWGDEPLVLSTPLMTWYHDHYTTPSQREDPDASPLLARLHDLPPALFTVGSADPLLDDTLFMAARWQAAGCEATLRLYPGAPHSFDTLPLPVGREAEASITRFLAACLRG